MMRALSRRSRRGAALLAASWFVASAMGCRDQVKVVPIDVSAPPPRTVRIGLIPEQNMFEQKNRYRPVADYLSEKAGVKIELCVLSRYGNILDNFVSNQLDGAFFGSFTGALALRKLGVEALARPEHLDGSSTYHGLVFTRKDSGITSGSEMKGKRFAFVDKATTAGYLLPLYYFKRQGIADHDAWFRETYFSGTHEASIHDVLEGRADVGAAKNTVFNRLASRDPRIPAELTILARSPDVPENSLCVRADLGSALKTVVEETLLEMEHDQEGREVLRGFGARRFIATTAEDYAAVFEFAAEIGLDLETYDYLND